MIQFITCCLIVRIIIPITAPQSFLSWRSLSIKVGNGNWSPVDLTCGASFILSHFSDIHCGNSGYQEPKRFFSECLCWWHSCFKQKIPKKIRLNNRNNKLSTNLTYFGIHFDRHLKFTRQFEREIKTMRSKTYEPQNLMYLFYCLNAVVYFVFIFYIYIYFLNLYNRFIIFIYVWLNTLKCQIAL